MKLFIFNQFSWNLKTIDNFDKIFIMGTWEIKDYITIGGIAATLIVGVWSLIVSKRNTKKTLYINTITAARIKYIDTVRNTISEFCALSFHFTITKLEGDQKQSVLQKIDTLRFLIKLQLNRNEPIDKSIIDLVDLIPDLVNPAKIIELELVINKLVMYTQDLLKGEWEGVKKESVLGELTKEEKTKTVQPYFNTQVNV